jgi:hypothetical protein
VFCAVLARSRTRFVRFADNERANTTLALLAQRFETLGAVPKVVLADRMGCLKGGVVADVVVPDRGLRRASRRTTGFRPDFCYAQDPESKGVVQHLVGYSKSDLMIGLGLTGWANGPVGLVEANTAARAWCEEVDSARHSEIAAQRLTEVERELLPPLPSLRPSIGRLELRKVDKLSCIRFGSVRYLVPTRLLTQHVEVIVDAASTTLTVFRQGTGEVLAEHPVMAPGKVSVLDAHYGSARPARPARKIRPRSAAEREFCELGPVAQQWLRSTAASGNTRLGPELGEPAGLRAAHGDYALIGQSARRMSARPGSASCAC